MEKSFTTSNKGNDTAKRRLIEEVLEEARRVNDLADGKDIRLANADAPTTRKAMKAILKEKDKPAPVSHVCSSGRRFG